MKKFKPLLVVCACLLILWGCIPIEYFSTLDIKSDWSGTLKTRISLPAQFLDDFPADDLVEAYRQLHFEGIKIEEVRAYRKYNWLRIDFNLSFRHIEQLNQLRSEKVSQKILEALKLSEDEKKQFEDYTGILEDSWQVQKAPQGYQLSIHLMNEVTEEQVKKKKLEKESNQKDYQFMSAFMGMSFNAKFIFKVNYPRTVVEHNADFDENKQLRWEVPFSALMNEGLYPQPEILLKAVLAR